MLFFCRASGSSQTVESVDGHRPQKCRSGAFEDLMHQKAADAGGSKRQAETHCADKISRLPFDT
jgi:hypothetical protein